ncbi:ABC transporter ATP-binding protein [Anaerotalea alkaliphila]|uniref:ABC transporter ATP-binding protein n=1 Tax=Anaerotalea alkaliphila TaxID=2662126 RepID=A0A7X5HU44_9FIRM|nr:ABC transporter ATP-binding protein [Anaerotalea alkaliphila]NDL66595.1 ABC transporter ATP-binding protein [Anaerotalea alkaliphila]
MIEVEDLYLKYPRAKEDTLRGVSFSVRQGETFGFLGPSGAGKSTLQKVLTGILRAYRGEVHVLGNEMRRCSPQFYEEIGVEFEFPNFYGKFTAMENLRYFSSLYAHPVADPMPFLERVGLADDADKLVSSYSKGMKMRLAFVRALLHEPKLLFLDEPTSGLDPASARTVKGMIKERTQAGATVILTTHNMHDAEELCDRVAFIVDGRIKALDTPAAFRSARPDTIVAYTYVEDGAQHKAEASLASLHQDARFMAHLLGGALTGIHSKESTLEDVFIELTGRGLQ